MNEVNRNQLVRFQMNQSPNSRVVSFDSEMIQFLDGIFQFHPNFCHSYQWPFHSLPLTILSSSSLINFYFHPILSSHLFSYFPSKTKERGRETRREEEMKGRKEGRRMMTVQGLFENRFLIKLRSNCAFHFISIQLK